MSSPGGRTSVLTAKIACHTCQKASERQRKEIKSPNLSNVNYKDKHWVAEAHNKLKLLEI
jgi:hypothetical protein